MRKPRRTRRIAAAVVAAAVVIGGSGAAYAYWSTSGTGTGSAAAAAAAQTVTATQTSTITTLAPGVAAQTLSGSITNPNPGPIYVTSVTASISSVTKSGGTTCTAADFTLTNPVMAVAHEVAAGTVANVWTGATLAFNDKPGVNQDACKGVTVNMSYTVS